MRMAGILLIALHCMVATHREIPIEIEIKSEKNTPEKVQNSAHR